MRDLRTLPKAHLHLHLEAAMRPATLVEFATRLGIPTPVTGEFSDFTEFGLRYAGLLSVFGVPANILRVLA